MASTEVPTFDLKWELSTGDYEFERGVYAKKSDSAKSVMLRVSWDLDLCANDVFFCVTRSDKTPQSGDIQHTTRDLQNEVFFPLSDYVCVSDDPQSIVLCLHRLQSNPLRIFHPTPIGRALFGLSEQWTEAHTKILLAKSLV